MHRSRTTTSKGRLRTAEMGLAAAQYVYKERGGRGRGSDTEGKESG